MTKVGLSWSIIIELTLMLFSFSVMKMFVYDVNFDYTYNLIFCVLETNKHFLIAGNQSAGT